MTDEAVTLPLLRGTTTLEAALEEEEDMLLDLDYPEQRVDFFVKIYGSRGDIAKLASYHLGLGLSDACYLGEVNEWVHGSFNVCIPLYVAKPDQKPEKRAVIRFPLPYKLGESTHPGNVDEKLRCEVATFIWMRDNCPDIPIPQLWGFGLVGGLSYTQPENTPLTIKIPWYIKRWLSWLSGSALPVHYTLHRRSVLPESGYLVMEYVGNSEIQMLSRTWDTERHDEAKRKNLFRGLSRIMLSLSQNPLPRIGSWTLDSNSVLRLSNRPLTLRYHQLENGGIPTSIDRCMTYPTADTYYLDLLSCHDSRIRHQPNSILDTDDGRAQMARLTIMRALLPHFTHRELREGPFFCRLTDLHQSNIYVDSQWNIKKVIDLEWACSLPAETLRPPYWLTGQPIDYLTGEHLNNFKQAYDEFVDAFEEEERTYPPVRDVCAYRTNLIRRGWQTGSFWYFHALDSPKGLFNLFEQHIHPIFVSSCEVSSDFTRVVSDYWAADAEGVVAAKLRDKEEYEQRLRERFANVCGNSES